MRAHVRTFLEPVARARLRRASWACYEEDARFALPDHMRFDGDSRAWGLSWMSMFDSPVFRWALTLKGETECKQDVGQYVRYDGEGMTIEHGIRPVICLTANAPCPHGADAKHRARVVFEILSEEYPWSFSVDSCSQCFPGTGTPMKLIKIHITAPTLNALWQSPQSQFWPKALRGEQDDAWFQESGPKRCLLRTADGLFVVADLGANKNRN